jgi:hypothetical protein
MLSLPTVGLKYRRANVEPRLRTKQPKRGRLDIVFFCAVGLNRCRLTSRGCVLADEEAEL